MPRPLWRFAAQLLALHMLPGLGPAAFGCDLITQTACGPRVIIGGAMKCGTNSVGDILSRHPGVRTNRCPGTCSRDEYQGDCCSIWETHYFTHKTRPDDPVWCTSGDGADNNLTEAGRRDCYKSPRALSKYARHLGGGTAFSFEKSPSYLDTNLFPHMPQRVREILPGVKLIFSLCEPAERLFSEYHHTLKWSKDEFLDVFTDAGVEPPRNFTEFIVGRIFDDDVLCQEGSRTDVYCNTWRDMFLRKGEYAEHIRDWLRAGFKMKDILVVDMSEDPIEKAKKILAHVGLPESTYPFDEFTMGKSFVNNGYKGRSSAWDEHPHAMQMLKEHYMPHNMNLVRLLRTRWNWTRH